jgi:TolA-binding protein
MSAYRSIFALTLAFLITPAAIAQRSALDQRVERVEKELRAVQRKVFPGGDQAFTTPEIVAQETATPNGLPASTPINDLTARVNALEKTMMQLTSQVEQQDHRLSVLSEQAAKARQEFSTRLQLIEQAAAPVAAVTPPPAPEAIDAPPPRPGATRPARPLPAAAPVEKPAADEPAPAASNDPAEDAYMNGYRLWTQKKYTEAQTALRDVVKKYPKSRRASYAQNLLGRAYLDAGRPANAAEAFAANYQTNPRGERAPDSLYYLGESLTKLGKSSDACRVYGEFDSAYGTTASASLKSRVAAARKTADCK